MMVVVATFHCTIIDAAFYSLVYMLVEDCVHETLIYHTYIIQSKGHLGVAVLS